MLENDNNCTDYLHHENSEVLSILSDVPFGVICNICREDAFFDYNIGEDKISFTKSELLGELSGRDIKNFVVQLRKKPWIYQDDISAFIDFLCGAKDQIIEFRYLQDDNEYIWCKAQGIVLRDDEGNSDSFLVAIKSMNKNSSNNKKFAEQGKTDNLTGLYNKDYTFMKIADFIEKSSTSMKHILFIININNFSVVNERLGSLFGDAVLTNIADNLRLIFDSEDILGRIGGDKFLVFIKDITKISNLEKKADEISNIFRDTYTGENKECNISCSIGASKYPQDGLSFGELFINADKALFDGIRNGGKSLQFYNNSLDLESFRHNKPYLNQYKLDEKHQKSGSFDKEITNFTFDIMSKTKDINSAINLLLDKIGRNFKCYTVSIIETQKDKLLTTTYQWASRQGESVAYNNQHLLDDILYDPDNFNESGIYDVPDINQINECTKKHEFRDSKITAFLQCAFYEGGVYQGCMCITDTNKRLWSQYERDTLLTITKIISSYLSKQRISEMAQKKLNEIMNFDQLTGLSTIEKFKKEAQNLVDNDPNGTYIVVYSDINNFKYFNEILGFEVGDQILKDFADILKDADKKAVSSARVSSDKFVAIRKLNDIEHAKNSVLFVNKQFAMNQKMNNILCNVVIVSGGSIVNAGDDITNAIDNANLARKSGKGSSKSVFNLYSKSMDAKIKKELEIINSMEEALLNHEFLIYLQPKICLENNKLAGAEALVRWNKKNDKMLYPDEFIPLFEKNGFIVNMDFYIYEEICKLLKKWISNGLPEITISMNVSRAHLNNDDFVERIYLLAKKYGISPRLLELELTESIFFDKPQYAIAVMKELRSYGFGVSIDDFGAGYSSLNLLKDMTSDVLKLDKGFFRTGDMKKEEKIIVSSIISMAKQLNMKVLSEGVETKHQSDFLKQIACDMAQGYLFAKPMPINDFEDLLRGNKTFEI